MAMAAGGVWSFDRSVWQPGLVVCTVWDQLFVVVSCSVAVEDFRTQLFLLRLLSHEDGDIDEEELVRCSSNPQTQNQVHCQFELNRWPSTAAPGSKSHPAHDATHQSPNVDQLNITEVQISMVKKKNAGKFSWTERTNRTTVLNQLNHWIHLTKVRSRNEKFVREEGRPHELSCGYSRTCAIFFAPRPRAFTKIAIFVLQNVPSVDRGFLFQVVTSILFSTRVVFSLVPSYEGTNSSIVPSYEGTNSSLVPSYEGTAGRFL